MKARSEPPESSATMSLQVSGTTKAKLAALAQHTRRTRSFLVNEAITDYVDRELAIIAGIQRGLADREAGRVTPHVDAMRQIRETIARAQQGK